MQVEFMRMHAKRRVDAIIWLFEVTKLNVNIYTPIFRKPRLGTTRAVD